MMVMANLLANEEKAKRRVFEDGLDEALSDIWRGATEPDMELSLLRGRQMTIEMPDNPQYLESLELISKTFGYTISKAATACFLLGLFEQYLWLKDSPLYRRDRFFRKQVDQMPHEIFYDFPEDCN